MVALFMEISYFWWMVAWSNHCLVSTGAHPKVHLPGTWWQRANFIWFRHHVDLVDKLSYFILYATCVHSRWSSLLPPMDNATNLSSKDTSSVWCHWTPTLLMRNISLLHCFADDAHQPLTNSFLRHIQRPFAAPTLVCSHHDANLSLQKGTVEMTFLY